MRKCCLPNDREWNAACKYRRRDHKKRYPHCHVPDQVADVIAREREVHPDVQRENKRKRERERMRKKRSKATADSNEISPVILAKAGKIKRATQKATFQSLRARHPKGNISEPETISPTSTL